MSEAGTALPVELERIGKYDVLEWIADGGFATLYKGRDPFLKRLVAIKVCTSQDTQLRQRFLHEAEIGGRLDHPNIVRTFDFGFEQVGPYLVQEYLPGEDLWQRIQEGSPIDAREKLGILLQVADGLAYSHRLGVLHLDIKPTNVRLLETGQAKILDFGIARLASGEGDEGHRGLVGTAGYLSPEQIEGGDIDARADVFAFGVLAYELLTHRRPFKGKTMGELLKQVVKGRPDPITRHWPECPLSVSEMVHRCMARQREQRYAGFDELVDELVEVLRQVPGDAGWVATSSRFAIQSTREAAAPPAAPPPLSARERRRRAAGSPFDTSPVELPRPRWTSQLQEWSQVPRRWAVAAVGLPLAAVVATTFLLGVDSGRPEDVRPRPAAAPAKSPASVEDPGTVLIAATPWGEVRSIVDAEGRSIDVPGDGVAPLRLWLAPGRYAIEIGGPESAEPWTCTAEVVAGGTHLCQTSLSEVSVTDYFKEMGWR